MQDSKIGRKWQTYLQKCENCFDNENYQEDKAKNITLDNYHNFINNAILYNQGKNNWFHWNQIDQLSEWSMWLRFKKKLALIKNIFLPKSYNKNQLDKEVVIQNLRKVNGIIKKININKDKK